MRLGFSKGQEEGRRAGRVKDTEERKRVSKKWVIFRLPCRRKGERTGEEG